MPTLNGQMFHTRGCTTVNDRSAREVCICDEAHPAFIGFQRESYCTWPGRDWCDCDWCRLHHHWTKN